MLGESCVVNHRQFLVHNEMEAILTTRLAGLHAAIWNQELLNTDQDTMIFYFKYNNHKEVLLSIFQNFCSLKLVGFLQVVTYA